MVTPRTCGTTPEHGTSFLDESLTWIQKPSCSDNGVMVSVRCDVENLTLVLFNESLWNGAYDPPEINAGSAMSNASGLFGVD